MSGAVVTLRPPFFFFFSFIYNMFRTHAFTFHVQRHKSIFQPVSHVGITAQTGLVGTRLQTEM